MSTLDSDTSWFLNEDLSSNTDYSSNPEYISAALPLDLDFGTGLTTPSTDPYSTEISSNNDDLLWNTDLNNNNNNLFTDNSLLLADCSSSAETFSLIGKKKSRLRRADTPTSCTNDGGVNNANTGVNNGLSLPIEIFSSPDGGLDALNRAVSGSNTEQNSDCVQITQGILPVGVCSTGRLQDTIVAGALSIEGVTFASITLRQVTICTFSPRGHHIFSLFIGVLSPRTDQNLGSLIFPPPFTSVLK